MRHSLIILAAVAITAGFSFAASPAKASPLAKLDSVATHTAAELVGYYRRRGYRYRPYRYWAPRYPRTYRYTRPYRYYYGPPYARYYRYPYRYRPYYGRRYYW